MRIHLIITISLCFLLLSVALTSHYPWPFFFFLVIFLPFLAPGCSLWPKPFPSSPPTPPGPSGIPILGCIPFMGPLAHRNLAHLAKSHGAHRLMSLTLGSIPVVISSHPDTAKQILSGPAFSDRPVKTSARLLMFERAIGFAPSGSYWRHLRRIAATNMFCPRRISNSEALRQKVGDEMVSQVWREMEKDGRVLLRGVLQKGSLESVVGSVFGTSLIGVSEKREVAEMVREGYELIGRFNWEDHFPSIGGLLDFHGVGRKCKCLAERVTSLFSRIVEVRRSGGGGDDEFREDDFLNVLLSLPEEERLSDSDVIAVLWEMIFRGTDVVAILLEWIMARLILHPNIQSKVQQELRAVVGARPVKDSDVPNLRYLQAVVKEVLRMHPPGPLLSWARLAVHDTHVGKFFVPAGTTAMVNMWAITHDPSIWKDPWTFQPERFIEEEVSLMGSDLRLAPFGSGKRVCPGRALGLATVHLWLARFLQEYNWTPSRPVQLAECLRLSMEMEKPLVCRVVRQGQVG